MKLLLQPNFETKPVVSHWLWRYGLAVILYLAVAVIATLLTYVSSNNNLTFLLVPALVATAWFGGLGPGLLLSVLLQATTIIFAPVPPGSSLAKVWFGYFSIFCLYVFLVLVISGLRNMQHQLTQQRDLLQLTLSSIGDAVVATDRSGNVTFMNPVAQQLTGWEESSARGLPLTEVFKTVNEETGETAVNPIQRVLSSGTPVAMTNHTNLISRTGEQIPIDNSAAPITDRGNVKGFVLVFSDVSERKLAERSRRESEIMQRIVEAQEGERHRIARELHDYLGQKMTALRLSIEALKGRSTDHPDLRQAIAELQRSASKVDRDIGFLSWELRPTELENLGLEDALRSFVREWSQQYGIPAEFHTDKDRVEPEERLPVTVETNLYRIVQEGLNNILKHAYADSVNVLLHYRGDQVVLIIEDDGFGFDCADVSEDGTRAGGLGLIGMRERAALLKGELEIDSSKGSGTTIIARIPLR